jgi:Tfp pilus assembly protein PilF
MGQLHDRYERLRERQALIRLQAGRAREAEQDLAALLAEARDGASQLRCLVLLASCRQRQGLEDQSQELLERALMLDPDDPGLNNDVAYGWIQRGVRLEQAERMIRSALARSPRHSAYLDTYGWLLYKRGEFAEAKKWLGRATGSRGGPDPVILDHLGDACWQLGEKQEAMNYWSRATERIETLAEEDITSDDERRVRAMTWRKLQAARNGREPDVAPSADAIPASRER